MCTICDCVVDWVLSLEGSHLELRAATAIDFDIKMRRRSANHLWRHWAARTNPELQQWPAFVLEEQRNE